jgi:choice-of-anchor B domain-containing protein
MRKLFLLYAIILSINIHAQEAWNLKLLSHYQDANLAKIGNQIWSECTGYADTLTHKEYAIAGSVDSIYFFDITNPSIMKKCDVETGLNRATNRDFEIYDHYMYCVSDNVVGGNGLGALQIFDLQYLPDSVHKVYESTVTGNNAHTIFINPKSKRLYKCSNRFGNPTTLSTPMDVFSLEDPLNPTFIATLNTPNDVRVHEVYVRNDTAYCSLGNSGLYIYDMTDATQPKLLGSITPPYPENAYNHSSWLDSSGKYILFTDENPEGTGLKIYNVSNDIFNPTITGAPFRDYGSPHNAYWVGRFAYVSMYYGGVNIYDLDTVTKPKLSAYYHTFTNAHTQSVYEGCWGVYPFLPSGNIIASDMNTGIYLLKPSANLAISDAVPSLSAITAFPNPFTKNITISLTSTEKQSAYLLVYDLQGKIAAERVVELTSGYNELQMEDLQNSSNGVYIMKLISTHGVYHQSIIKH